MKPAPLIRRSRKNRKEDLINAAASMDMREVRKVVALSFTIDRLRQSTRSKYTFLTHDGVSGNILSLCVSDLNKIRDQLLMALDVVADQHYPARWARFMGLGPRTAAGLLAHVDVDKVKHVSQLMTYSGFGRYGKHRHIPEREVSAIIEEACTTFKDPKDEECIKWLADRTNRRYDTFYKTVMRCCSANKPISWDTYRSAMRSSTWNRDFHVVCRSILHKLEVGWPCADSRTEARMYYANKYRERKQYEMRCNERKLYKDQAATALARGRFSSGSSVYNYYASGMLPPVHLTRRALRWTLRLLLSHYLEVAYYDRYKGEKVPDEPYILNLLKKKDGKDRKVPVPFWPWESRDAD